MTAMVRARALTYHRAGRTILDGVDLVAEAGTATAVVGPSGSGKSTLLALLAGLDEPDSGEVHREAGQGEIGLVLQGYGLVGLLTAAENVEIALQPGGKHPRARSEVRQRAADELARVRLAGVADHLVEELSGGQQQRVAVARALAVRPRLLFADEFTAELDSSAREQIAALILGTLDHGTTLIIATHDLALADLCDQIVHL